MRKLASIREIADVRPIDGADAIEVASVDGWQVVVKRGEFRTGDLCVYHEIDSFLPVTMPQYEFLATRGVTTDAEGNRGARLRTIKLRGQLSQGLALPVREFFLESEIQVGEDVTDRLGVRKWEPPIPACLSGQMRGDFPSWIRKTDQERIQNMPSVLEIDTQWEVTVKLDGSSMTAYHRDGEIGVCSRNIDLAETEGNTFWRVARESRLIDKILELGTNVAMQGELIGEGIQGNPEKIKGHQFRLFDIWLIDEGRFVAPNDRAAITASLEIPHVPIVEECWKAPEGFGVGDILALADGPSLNPHTKREGLVFKSACGQHSFKAISNSYLLKNKD